MVAPSISDPIRQSGTTSGSLGSFFQDDLFVDVPGLLADSVVRLKLEGFNFSGSIKIKTALSLVCSLEESGQLFPGKKVIESSSGNLGVALSMVCLTRRYPFVCVVDPNAAQDNLRLIETYGGTILLCRNRDANGGYLQSRIDLIQQKLREDPGYVWTNQYANAANSDAHRRWTAPAILRNNPNVDFLFIGAGTTGTLMGCAQYFREHAPHVKIIAVDPEGSVTFGYPPAKRFIPGIGTSRRPELCDPTLVEDIVMVPEVETIAMCHRIRAEHGALIGGSTGSVLAAIVRYARSIPAGSLVLTIAPDLGERYMDTIYDEKWVREHFPALRLETNPRRWGFDESKSCA